MTKPKKYQREDVDRLHDLNGRALLANSMGTGKSFEVLLYLKELDKWPAVIVCPASLKLHWQREAKHHVGLKSHVLYGLCPHKEKETLKDKKILILNYDILRAWYPELKRLDIQVLVGDECHEIGNQATQRSKAFKRLAQGVPHLIGISGTPLTNRPWELYPILSLLDPKTFNSPFAFGQTYCNPTFSFGRWQFKGGKNLKRLHQILSESFMIRRTMEEVMPEIPGMITTVVPLDIEKRKEYDLADRDLIAWLSKFDLAAAHRAAAAEEYVRFTYLKQLAATLKLKQVFNWLDNFLEAEDGKILVGTIHRNFNRALSDRYGLQCEVIQGGMSARERQTAEDRFRKSRDCRMLFGQIKACGVGLNLPEASTAVVAELPWTPGAVQQFLARIRRMTSTEPTRAYFLVAHNTIEEVIIKIIDSKVKILDMVLDGRGASDSSLTILEELTKAMKEKANA